ncbi:hypothetical protein, partial [Kitasatospora herbaricolor]|uniref:hypothetical protein n=1 Tax=Kitasatospora herbaricolor TaxID=68217 RepID=UPI0036D75F85
AHEYFAQRNRLALVAIEEMLTWKDDPHTAARELLGFWQGLEALWSWEESLDVLKAWDSVSARFFVASLKP